MSAAPGPKAPASQRSVFPRLPPPPPPPGRAAVREVDLLGINDGAAMLPAPPASRRRRAPVFSPAPLAPTASAGQRATAEPARHEPPSAAPARHGPLSAAELEATFLAARGYYVHRNDPAGAIPLLSQVLARDPDNAKARVERGTLYTRVGDFSLARQDLTRACELEPASPTPFMYRALYYLAVVPEASDRALGDLVRVVTNVGATAPRHPEFASAVGRALGRLRAAMPKHPKARLDLLPHLAAVATAKRGIYPDGSAAQAAGLLRACQKDPDTFVRTAACEQLKKLS